ncbi:hypothetical protein [Variovorax sp. Root318D1]|uniref:hypothetical protein n=1 Tax=Variovorax sp. Root318D1 TaxID=1736513 RepID=UPI001F2DEDC3|nr:hypothetical protein [Variovorax sp. Root318D1]
MSVQALRSSFGNNCHWCGLPMDFAEPRSAPESATIEHLNDSTLGGVRKQKHRRLSHAICNQARNEFKLQAERGFQRWIAERVETAALARVTNQPLMPAETSPAPPVVPAAAVAAALHPAPATVRSGT